MLRRSCSVLKETSTWLVFDSVGHAEPDDRVGSFLRTSQPVAHSSAELWHCLSHSCISNNTADNFVILSALYVPCCRQTSAILRRPSVLEQDKLHYIILSNEGIEKLKPGLAGLLLASSMIIRVLSVYLVCLPTQDAWRRNECRATGVPTASP
jgi:hypothetical protein